jgi:hypothetical protein
MTLEQKQEDWKKRKGYAELKGEAFDEPFPEADKPADPPASDALPPEPKAAELTDESVIAFLNEKGIKTTNLQDLMPQPSAEEIAQAKQKRTTDMLAYGLSTGKFKKEEYDAFQNESANKLAVAMAEIETTLTEKIKAANPDLTQDQVAEQVAQYTFSNLPEDSILRKEREQELLLMADGKLKNKYKNIYGLEADFEQHEQGMINKTNRENKVQAALPVFQKDIDAVLGSLSFMEVPVNDTQNEKNNATVKVTFNETDLKEVKESFLHPDNVVRQLTNGYTVDELKEQAELMLLKKHFPRLISQAAIDYNSGQKDKYMKARKGLRDKETVDVSDDNLEVNENTKFYDDLKAEAAATGLIAKPAAPQT